MELLSSVRNFHNSKLFFSKKELTNILDCYAIGVSKGNWKDYAIVFDKKEASFYMYKHSLASPDCVLTKTKKSKKSSFIYNLKIHNKNKTIYNQFDNLIALLKRNELRII